MCVTHNNIARGDSLIAFALTISESLFKDNTVTFPILHFCKRNCAFFFLFSMAVVISHIGNVAVLSSGKNGLFFTIFFFPDFFLHLAVVLLFLGSHILGKGMFSKRRLFIYFLFVFFFRKEIFAFPFFSARNIIKSWEERKRSEIERKMEKWFWIVEKSVCVLSLKLILYLAKIFDFEFQHHDHQTLL